MFILNILEQIFKELFF